LKGEKNLTTGREQKERLSHEGGKTDPAARNTKDHLLQSGRSNRDITPIFCRQMAGVGKKRFPRTVSRNG